jgi:hypothetical protein
MSKKSKTQMTKAELIDLAYTLENKAKELEEQIEAMQNDRIALDTIIADQDTSMIISGMNARIKMLEDKILDVESRKNYE